MHGAKRQLVGVLIGVASAWSVTVVAQEPPAELPAETSPVVPVEAPVALPEAAPAEPPVEPPEPATPTYRAIAVPPVVVTGRRWIEPLLHADRSLHRVERERLPEAAGAGEAVANVSGVHLQQTNRGAGAPILRGLVGPQNLLVVDGIRFSNSTFRTGPNQYLTLLDPAQADRFEVLVGPGSVLYGSDAMGGLVQMVPAAFPDQKGLGGRAGLRLASADTAGAGWGEVRHSGDTTAAVLGIAARRFGALTTGGGNTAPASDYSQLASHARLRWQPVPTVETTLNGLLTTVNDQGRTDRLTAGQLRWYDNRSDFAWADATWKPRDGAHLRMALSLHRTDERVDLYRCTMGKGNPAVQADSLRCVEAARHVRDTDGTPAAQLTRQEDNHDQVLTPGLLVTGLWTGLDGTLKLTGGADAYQDDVASTKRERRSDKAWTWANLPRGSFSDGSTWRQTGAFGHADWDLWRAGDHTVTVSAGARGTATAAHAAGVPAVGDVDHAFAGAVGSAGLRWLLKDRAMTYVSLNQGFRAPNLQETTVLGNTGSKFEVPNGELKPERSDTLELGARLALPKVTLHAVGYMSRIADAIDERKLAQSEFAAFGVDAADVGCKAFDDPACKPIPVVQRVNAERGQVVGSEASAVVGPFAGASVWLQGMWLRGEVETPSLGKPAGETVPMRRMPPPQGSAGLRYERGTWRAEIGTRFAAAQDRLHPSDEDDLRMCENPAALGATYKATAGAPKCPGTPGWVTMDARVGTKLGDMFRADLALTNALDARYRTHASGLDAPGRSFVLTLVGER